VKILIADDEKALIEMLKEIFKQNKIDCDTVFNGQDAVDYATLADYDLIILDIMMPKLNGYQALQEMRKNGIKTPILMLSAKSAVEDKVDGLNFGADDYLTKPFATSELLARVNALTRRKGEYIGEAIAFADLSLNKNNFSIAGNGQEIKLSSTEYKIMELLLLNPAIITNKERLIEKIWGWDSEAVYNNAEVYISFLRKKLTALRSKVSIKAVRNVGYCLEVAK